MKDTVVHQDKATLFGDGDKDDSTVGRIEVERADRDAEIARCQRQEERRAKWREDAALIEKYTVQDEASLVTCAAGLEIWHVVTGFDLCKIKIKNLPQDSKESEIADILMKQNIPFTEFLITRHRITGDTSEESVLVGKKVSHALALEVDGLVFRDKVISVEVRDHTTRHAMLSTERISPYLTVSWRGQTDTLIASYPSNAEAVKRAKALNGVLWKGQRLAASLNQHQPSSSSTKSVKITGYPLEATSNMEFLDFIGTHSYRILKTKPYHHQCTLIMVRIHLRQQNGVRMETYKELTPLADETRVTVHFDDWENLKRAHATTHHKKLGTGDETTPTLRASCSSPFQYSIEISRRQFWAQEKQWNALKDLMQEKEALVTTQLGDTIIIYVLGYDLRKTGALKVRVEKLASGEPLDASHWHSNFANHGKKFFRGVQAETGVHIKVDSKKQSLKIFGEMDKVVVACSIIKAEVQRLRSMETTGDDKRLGEQLGKENDDDSLREDKCELWTPRIVSCVVCYCEAAAPEYLGCGHVYCTECLRHLLASAADARIFPISCIDSTCNTPLPIPIIRRFMDNQAFRRLVEVAFMCHIEQHPEEYKYCMTPDCKQIYRRGRKEAWQCPSCLLKICTACEEESHEGLTCAERRLQVDPEKLKEKLGFRRCPQCSAWIEKVGGCNHITCKCGSHICWRCMGHIPVSDMYKHLSKARCKFYKPLPQKSATQASVSTPNRCPDQKVWRQDAAECQATRERCVII